jgi:hypothetical protein
MILPLYYLSKRATACVFFRNPLVKVYILMYFFFSLMHEPADLLPSADIVFSVGQR